MPSKTIFTNEELDRMIRAPAMAYEWSHHGGEIARWEEELSMSPDRQRIQQYLKAFGLVGNSFSSHLVYFLPMVCYDRSEGKN